MELHFLIISENVLKRKDLSGTEKLILGLIESFERNGKVCFATPEWIQEQLGLSEKVFWKAVEKMEKKEIIRKDGMRWIML